jgi:hypothetical protein
MPRFPRYGSRLPTMPWTPNTRWGPRVVMVRRAMSVDVRESPRYGIPISASPVPGHQPRHGGRRRSACRRGRVRPGTDWGRRVNSRDGATRRHRCDRSGRPRVRGIEGHRGASRGIEQLRQAPFRSSSVVRSSIRTPARGRRVRRGRRVAPNPLPRDIGRRDRAASAIPCPAEESASSVGERGWDSGGRRAPEAPARPRSKSPAALRRRALGTGPSAGHDGRDDRTRGSRG